MDERSPWIEMEPDAGVRRRRERWRMFRYFAVFAPLAFLLSRGLDWVVHRVPQPFWDTYGRWIVMVGGLALFVGFAWSWTRTSKVDPFTLATSERKLGLPYRVHFGDFSISQGWWTLVIGEQSIEVDPHGGAAPWARDRAQSIPFGDIVLVRSRVSWIDIVCEREGRRTTFEVRNIAYADRQRMLWELAVRVPEAVERGIGSVVATATPTAASASTKTQPSKSSSGDAAPRAADSGPALPGMDAAMTGLGSSLVADATRNPPPPKSALGCGLFVGTPHDEE